jgi:hypothetical protein
VAGSCEKVIDISGYKRDTKFLPRLVVLLMPTAMKITIFLYVTQCNMVDVYGRFGGKLLLHL